MVGYHFNHGSAEQSDCFYLGICAGEAAQCFLECIARVIVISFSPVAVCEFGLRLAYLLYIS
ncbi:MAG: hypothetical protein QOF02_3800 [Blastocatellia bacterium]|nr:hypothetical protein [Blastocatellia bacterium]